MQGHLLEAVHVQDLRIQIEDPLFHDVPQVSLAVLERLLQGGYPVVRSLHVAYVPIVHGRQAVPRGTLHALRYHRADCPLAVYPGHNL